MEGLMGELEVRRREMKEWAVRVFGGIPRAYPIEIVYSFAPREVKPVIDASTLILAESAIWYINYDDPFTEYDEDEVMFSVRLPDGTVIDCTPANFLSPDCAWTYYHRRSSARSFLDYRPLGP